MNLHIVRADPAGNITLYVLDPVEKEQRGPIAEKLMAIPALKAEQVGYVCAPTQGTAGRMEMAGGEFCGNGTRAFGYYLARRQGLTGRCDITIEVSGCDHPVTVALDMDACTARAEMPLPLFVRPETVDGITGTLVHLGGIAHFVVVGVEPSLAFFEKAEAVFRPMKELDAYGVMFLEPESGRMTPLVKCPAANSLYWEGSCGSGSLAAAIAQSEGQPDGEFVREYIQPSGTVCATAVRQNGRVTAAYIGGCVAIEDAITVEV